MQRPDLKDYHVEGNTYQLAEYMKALEEYCDQLEKRAAKGVPLQGEMTVFLKDYMQLRKRQQEYFKKRSKEALIFCKENEPKLDNQAQELYQQLTQPQLFEG
jgi:hypothetical protein